MKTIIFANQKGGVGKTTSTLCTASLLAEKFNILVIDGDSQSNLSSVIKSNTEIKYTLDDLLSGECDINECIVKSSLGDFDYIQGDTRLVNSEKRFTNPLDMMLLKRAFKNLNKTYDYCIIDCPPNLSILSINYFNVADYIVVPLNASSFSIQGLKQLYEIISEVKDELNPKIKIAGLLLTQFNQRTIIGQEAYETLEAIAKEINTKVFKTTIRRSVAIEKVITERRNIANSKGAKNIKEDYTAFVDELLETINQ